jgi:hypothetical protein
MATAATPARRSPRPPVAGVPPIPTVRVYESVLDEGTKDETRPRMAEATLNGMKVTIGEHLWTGSSDAEPEKVYLALHLGEKLSSDDGHYTVAQIRDFIAVLLAAFHRAKRDGLLPGRAPVEIVR